MIFLIKKREKKFKWLIIFKTIRSRKNFSRLVEIGRALVLMVVNLFSLSRRLLLIQIRLYLLEQFVELLFSFDVFIEGNYFFTEFLHFWNLRKQNGVKFLNILFNIGTWFIDIFENSHFLFYNLNAFFTTCVMFENKHFFVFQYLFN